MLVLSITLSSPLLALSIFIHLPIPIPTGLFDVHAEPPSAVLRTPSPAEMLARYGTEYKCSGSITVVEGRCSSDIWISKGDAVDGKGKVGRAIGLMSPVPRLAVLPIDDEEKGDGEQTPPLPMQEVLSFPSTLPLTPASTNSAGMGRLRKESKVSSYLSNGEEAFASRIMIAQRHYSAVATTVVIPASPERQEELVDGVASVVTGIALEHDDTSRPTSHLRSRSISSVIGQAITTGDISPPPSDPLPPMPPNIRNAKLAQQLIHKKSYSSGFSFSAVINNDVNEIDVLTAGVLPLLVPGLKVGGEMKIKDFEFSPPLSSTVTKKPRRTPKESHGSDFGILAQDGFSSPHLHSTPTQDHRRARKISTHRRNHFSLPR